MFDTHSPRRLPVVLALVVLTASPRLSPAATFRVGSEGSPCTHATLAAAVAAAAANGPGLDTILLSDNITLTAQILINDQSLEIAGGFMSCSDTAPTSARSLVSVQVGDAIFVTSPGARLVTLQGLSLIRSAATPVARLLRIEGNPIVTLANTLLSNGAVDNGANVWMSGAGLLLITDWQGSTSNIYGGGATGIGGGIYCQGGATITLDSGGISGNRADGNGGGAYLNGCTLRVWSGHAQPVVCGGAQYGVVCNRSENGVGGGIYATNGSDVELTGTAAVPALVAENVADEGGGIHATGPGTTVVAQNAWINDNIGAFEGGGVYVRNSASFTMTSTAADCRGLLCSQISRNNSNITGGIGAGVAADSGADVVIRQAYMTGNTANVTGSVIFAEDAGTTVALEGLVVRANSGSLNDAYFETDDGAVLTMAFSTVDEGMGCCKGLFDTNNGSTVNLYSSILMAIFETTGEGRIFDEPIAAGETRFGDCLLHREHVSTLPPPVDGNAYETIVSPGTLFVNRAAGDLRLRRGSQAQDFCDTVRYTPATTDIDREPRGWDDPTVADSPFGPYDLGADEWRPLLIADHEEGNCSDWTSDTSGC
jgi:hypothetical protein